MAVFSDIDKKPLPKRAVTGKSVGDAHKGVRRVDFDDGGVHQADIYDWTEFEPGMNVVGPAIIEDPTATLVISPGKSATMDDYGNIHIELRAS